MSHLGVQTLGQGSVLRLRQRSAPPVSPSGEGRIYFDGTQFLQSSNGGPYVPVGSGSGGGDQVRVQYANANAGTLTLGQVVAIFGSDSVDRASAVANNDASKAIGFVYPTAGIAPAATGDIVVAGRANARFLAGLTLAPKDEVLLSLTSGSLTNDVSAFAAGNVVFSVGFVKSLTPIDGGAPYDGGANLIAQIQVQWGGKIAL